MSSGMENMLDMYLFETHSLMEELDELLINAERNENFSEEDINEIFRIMHTIKGSSAMMEFDSLMRISHKVEDMFFFIRDKGIEGVNQNELFNLMFHSNDFLRAEVSKVEAGEELMGEDEVNEFLHEIEQFLDQMNGVVEIRQTSNEIHVEPEVATDHELLSKDYPFGVRVYFEQECKMENLRAFMLINSIQEMGVELRFVPEDIEGNPETANVIKESGFFVCFQSEQELNMALDVIKNSLNVDNYEIFQYREAASTEDKRDEQMKTQEIHKEISSKGKGDAETSNRKQTNSNSKNNNKQNLINVSLSKLDNLLNIVGEIVITEAMVTSSPNIAGLQLDDFTKSARQLRKLTNDLQDIVMSIRMVPVSGVFHKMNRIVRDMGQQLNKKVKLTMVGETTEVDKAIVDGIADPIMHLVRNAMDHGIEENENDRLLKGKELEAEITLSAEHIGGEVIIKVMDDGRGIDPEVILEKAKQKNILTKDESEYSKKEILNLLMHPGFSTKEQVTEFSGRGVGMDVVKKNIEEIGGRISLASEFGKGTSITFNIPLTLAIADGMQMRVGDSIFTIPISNIRQSFKVKGEEIARQADGSEMVERMGKFYPVVRIYDLLSVETQVKDIEEGILIWVESGGKSYCLFVDQLIGEQQVVVKPLPTYLNRFDAKESGISGCTILGNGNISIILDVVSLISYQQDEV